MITTTNTQDTHATKTTNESFYCQYCVTTTEHYLDTTHYKCVKCKK